MSHRQCRTKRSRSGRSSESNGVTTGDKTPPIRPRPPKCASPPAQLGDPTRLSEAILSHGRRFELESRRADVDQRSELVYIAVAVVVQRDVGGDVERCAWQLGRERPGRVLEIVVAVDEDARVPIRQRSLETLDRDIGKAEIDRAFDV